MPANAIASVGCCSNGFVGGMAPLSSRLLNMKLGAAGRQPDCNRESGRAIGARIIALDRYRSGSPVRWVIGYFASAP